jgi:hypothetical protein
MLESHIRVAVVAVFQEHELAGSASLVSRPFRLLPRNHLVELAEDSQKWAADQLGMADQSELGGTSSRLVSTSTSRGERFTGDEEMTAARARRPPRPACFAGSHPRHS